jgi:hypothetical protein
MPPTLPVSRQTSANSRFPIRRSWKPLLALCAGLLLAGCDEVWDRSAEGTFEDPSNRPFSRQVVSEALSAAPPRIEFKFKDWSYGALVYVEGQGVKGRDKNMRATFQAESLSSTDYDVAGDWGEKYDSSFSLRHEPDGSFSIKLKGSSVWVKYAPRKRAR